MKRTTIKRLVIAFIVLAIIAACFVTGKKVIMHNTSTGAVETGLVETGIVDTNEALTGEIVIDLVAQPNLPGGYEANTKVLRDYLGVNMETVEIPANMEGGTISFFTNKSLSNGAITVKTDVILNNRKVYGRLDVSRAVVDTVGGAYTFDLTDFPVKLGSKQIGGNIFEQIKGKSFSIGAFVGENNNRVEKIVIKYYYFNK